jgi:hypothetical protein
MIFCREIRNFLDLNPELWIQLRVPNTQQVIWSPSSVMQSSRDWMARL